MLHYVKSLLCLPWRHLALSTVALSCCLPWHYLASVAISLTVPIHLEKGWGLEGITFWVLKVNFVFHFACLESRVGRERKTKSVPHRSFMSSCAVWVCGCCVLSSDCYKCVVSMKCCFAGAMVLSLNFCCHLFVFLSKLVSLCSLLACKIGLSSNRFFP